MGFKQRERKRKRKAAAREGQVRSRETGSSAPKWWLTPLTSTGCCARCGLVIREGSDGVYRHVPREVRCVPCASQREDSKGYRPSVRWEQQSRVRPGRAARSGTR